MTETQTAPATDRELLRRFADRRDGAAFAALVGRHGPAVHGVCRRALGDGPDADDAFQATFLVLARKADGVGRPEQLGGWLYAVAVRCARRARAARAARWGRQRPMPDLPAPQPDPDWADVRPVLDEEIAALPDKLRAAVVLCELDGLDRVAAAAALGVPAGTVSSRLARGKDTLRRRLARRGVALTAIGIAALLTGTARAAVPPALSRAAVAAATRGGGSRAALSLANAEVTAMFWAKAMRLGLAAALVLAAVGGPAAVGISRAVAAAAEDGKPDKEKLLGDWVVKEAKRNGQPPPEGDHVLGEKLTISGDRLTFGPFVTTWKVDPAKTPKHIDCTIVEGPENEKGQVSKGVYKLEGGKLSLHLSHPGSDRPADFDNKAGENTMLLILERVKK